MTTTTGVPAQPVPFHATANPRHRTVAAGTLLWRVIRHAGHPDAPAFAPGELPGGELPAAPLFRGPRHDRGGRPAESLPSGRFDPCPEHDFAFCAAALDDVSALAETLLRDAAPGGGVRPVLAAAVRDRSLEVLETRRALALISLVSAEDLAAAWQDNWLIQAGVEDYVATRCWGHWLRQCAGTADGLIWRSRHQPDGLNVLLFGDRCAADVAPSPLGHRRLDDPNGLEWLNRRLALLRTYVVPHNVDDNPHNPDDNPDPDGEVGAA